MEKSKEQNDNNNNNDEARSHAPPPLPPSVSVTSHLVLDEEHEALKEGYSYLPMALANGTVTRHYHLPYSAALLLQAAHQHFLLTGERWISRKELALLVEMIHPSTVRRVSEACVQKGLAQKRINPRGVHLYRFDSPYRFATFEQTRKKDPPPCVAEVIPFPLYRPTAPAKGQK